MAKRKRDAAPPRNDEPSQQARKRSKAPAAIPSPSSASATAQMVVQIVAGSYDRVLHGLTASISNTEDTPSVEFADTFLFDAHTSAIKCLAVSPPSAPAPGQSQSVMLATGGTDERINVYTISAHPPRRDAQQQQISSLAPRPVLENSKNRELGTLLHHSSTITRLCFPTRSKLMSASEDSTIAVTRTRDWSLLSAIKAPIPKAWGRPSGDTAPLGGVPSGVNDFAVHPSMKLMISVSKGERCMRLWNLVTGKKAGVLNFDKDLLHQMGEGKLSMGEGRSVVWGSVGGDDEFAVAFDREVLVYGMGGTPRCRVVGNTRNKVHRVRYVQVGDDDANYLAVSTEDGRICLYSTRGEDLQQPKAGEGAGKKDERVATAMLVGVLGGRERGITSRIKDFVVLSRAAAAGAKVKPCIFISGSSDGKLGIWSLTGEELAAAHGSGGGKQVGKLVGSYETQNRITCITAFEMIPRPEGADAESSEEEEEGATDEDEDNDDKDE